MVAPSPPPPLTARRAPQVLAYPRKDAFEVWFLLQEDGRTFAKEVVFSRVRCHRWPDNEAVLERLFCTVAPHRPPAFAPPVVISAHLARDLDLTSHSARQHLGPGSPCAPTNLGVISPLNPGQVAEKMDEHHDELRERRKAKRAETIMQAHQAKKEAEALQARCLPPRPAAAHL